MRSFGTLAWWCLIGVIVAGASATKAHGQGQPVHGSVSGLVVDSLRGGVLARAFVSTDPGGRSALTDADGRFVIDSIPPGSYRLILAHQLLDTLGIVLASPQLEVALGRSAEITLGVPASETILRLKCGPEAEAAILGIISEADSDGPASGAVVNVSWVEITLNESRLAQTQQTRTATAAADGSFRMCDVPAGVVGEMYAARGTARTRSTIVTTTDGGLVLTGLTLRAAR